MWKIHYSVASPCKKPNQYSMPGAHASADCRRVNSKKKKKVSRLGERLAAITAHYYSMRIRTETLVSIRQFSGSLNRL